jgi:RNA polymerase sigma factor (sigma-70 family)
MPPSPQAVLVQTYLENRETLLRVFSASLRDRALAEDVLQDLYLKISAIDPGGPVDNPLAYLFRAANNIALNRHRATKSKVAREKAWQGANVHSIGAEVVADEVSAEAQVIGKQQLAHLMTALAELPEASQTVVRLHKFEGVSQVEVARHLGVSISTVEKRLSAALKHLMQRARSHDTS